MDESGQSVDEPISRLSIYTFSLLFREKIKRFHFSRIMIDRSNVMKYKLSSNPEKSKKSSKTISKSFVNEIPF